MILIFMLAEKRQVTEALGITSTYWRESVPISGEIRLVIQEIRLCLFPSSQEVKVQVKIIPLRLGRRSPYNLSLSQQKA